MTVGVSVVSVGATSATAALGLLNVLYAARGTIIFSFTGTLRKERPPRCSGLSPTRVPYVHVCAARAGRAPSGAAVSLSR